MNLVRKLAPPLLAFVLARGLSWAVAAQAGADAFAAGTWVKWDAGLYLDVARNGYQLFRCGSTGWGQPDDWCGNAGLMPLYPAAIALARLGGAGDPFAGAALAALFHLGTLALLW